MTEFSFTWISFGGSHLLRSAHQKCSCPVFGGFYLINRLANGCLQPLVIGEFDRVVFTFTVGWAHYFVGLFQANALLSQWLVFSSVQRDRSTFLFICSTSSTWTTDIENIFETTELRPKQNHWHPEPRKHSIHPLVCFTPFFFGTMRLLFEIFWIPPTGITFVCFDSWQHNGCHKIPKGPLFHFSALCHCSKNSLKNIPWVPVQLFFIFCNQLEFRKPRRVTFCYFES